VSAYIDYDIPSGYDLIWMDGFIIAAFEVLDDGHGHEQGVAIRSIETTCDNKGWIFSQEDNIIGFDPVANEIHEFQIISIKELPRFNRLRVYSNHVSDILF
jgi:hypothetical protein